MKTELKFSPVDIDKRKKADIRTGDRVRVMQKITEKGKTRLQPFEGLVIARKHGAEPGATFTVRRATGDYGVEKIFPLYSPSIEKIDILRRSKVRQSNIYHVRLKVARAIRREMRRMRLMDESVVSGEDQKEESSDSEDQGSEETLQQQEGNEKQTDPKENVSEGSPEEPDAEPEQETESEEESKQ